MKVDQDRNVSNMSGMLETKEFSINLDGMMFNNLINGMYSDKIAAPIREISTNARDGHAAVGLLDTPFDVCLPSSMTPVFSVRDFGCSLTHDEVMNMYSVLGKSTKRDSDEQTGCLGLGSKSPFAYTSTFNVTCWKDGEMRVYSAYISTGGQPQISLVSRECSNEPSGVLVSIAVKREDISSFNKTANKVYVGFEPKPNIINSSSEYRKEERRILYEGTGWKMFDEIDHYNAQQSYAIQGSVAYPIKRENSDLSRAITKYGTAIKEASYSWSNDTTKEAKILKNCPMVITFDIGQLNTTTSREDLAYDEKTCKSIAERLTQISDEIKDQVNAKYEKCDSHLDARLLLSEDMSLGNIRTMMSNVGIEYDKMKYKGNPIKPYMTVHYNDHKVLVPEEKVDYNHNWTAVEISKGMKVEGITILDNRRYKNKIGTLKATFTWSSIRECEFINTQFHSFYNDQIFLIQCMDVENKSDNNKIRNFWMNDAGNRENLWVRVADQQAGLDLIKLLGNKKENFHWLNDYDDLRMPSKAKTATGTAVVKTKDTFRTIQPQRWGDTSTSFEDVLVTDTAKRITFYQKGGRFYLTEKDLTAETNGFLVSTIKETVWKWEAALNITTKRPLVLNTKNIGMKKTRNIFIDAQDWIEKELKLKVTDLEGLLLKRQNYRLVQDDPSFFQKMKELDRSTLPKLIVSMIDVRDSTIKLAKNLNYDLIDLYEEVFPEEAKTASEALDKKKKLNLNVEKLLSDDNILATLLKASNERYGYTFNHKVSMKALNDYLQIMKRKD